MATRSNIAIQNEDGTVQSVYCHWDGYLEHNGKLLLKHYNTEETIKELISNGSLSSLGERINPIGDLHDFDNKEEGTTVFYARDRGESVVVSRFDNINQWTKNIEEYGYIWMKGQWHFISNSIYTGKSGLKKLTPKDCKEKSYTEKY